MFFEICEGKGFDLGCRGEGDGFLVVNGLGFGGRGIAHIVGVPVSEVESLSAFFDDFIATVVDAAFIEFSETSVGDAVAFGGNGNERGVIGGSDKESRHLELDEFFQFAACVVLESALGLRSHLPEGDEDSESFEGETEAVDLEGFRHIFSDFGPGAAVEVMFLFHSDCEVESFAGDTGAVLDDEFACIEVPVGVIEVDNLCHFLSAVHIQLDLLEAGVEGTEEFASFGGSDDPADIAAVCVPAVLDGEHTVFGLDCFEEFFAEVDGEPVDFVDEDDARRNAHGGIGLDRGVGLDHLETDDSIQLIAPDE